VSLILAPEQDEAIRSHAVGEYPNECCGILIGQVVEAASYASLVIALNNHHEDGTARRFRIKPDDLMQAEKLARQTKLSVIGFYHSHPDVPAVPSSYDKEHAWEAYSYLIVELNAGVAGSLRSWKLDLDADKFNEENVLVNRCVLEAAAAASVINEDR